VESRTTVLARKTQLRSRQRRRSAYLDRRWIYRDNDRRHDREVSRLSAGSEPDTVAGRFTDTDTVAGDNADTYTGFADTYTGFADTYTGFADTDASFADTDTGFADTDTGFADTDASFADTDTGIADTDTGIAVTFTVMCTRLYGVDHHRYDNRRWNRYWQPLRRLHYGGCAAVPGDGLRYGL